MTLKAGFQFGIPLFSDMFSHTTDRIKTAVD